MRMESSNVERELGGVGEERKTDGYVTGEGVSELGSMYSTQPTVAQKPKKKKHF